MWFLLKNYYSFLIIKPYKIHSWKTKVNEAWSGGLFVWVKGRNFFFCFYDVWRKWNYRNFTELSGAPQLAFNRFKELKVNPLIFYDFLLFHTGMFASIFSTKLSTFPPLPLLKHCIRIFEAQKIRFAKDTQKFILCWFNNF